MDKIKILVVDDESRMRKLVHDFLAREGYEVLEAGDGEEALDIFYQQKDIALLVLDIMMPRINGFEVCREIRQTSKVPIIMLTAKGDERDELNGFDIGADEYISKPFSPKILVARVNALLRRANKLGKEAVISEAGGIVMDKTAHTVAIVVVINPSDDVEARAAVQAAYEHQGPVYMRFGRLAVPVINDRPDYQFELGKGVVLREGKDLTIIATGLPVSCFSSTP